MAVVTATTITTEVGDMTLSYFDGKNQLVPFQGFFVEGHARHVPEDEAPGWVIFELTDGSFQDQACELARILFCNLGFTSDEVRTLLEDF